MASCDKSFSSSYLQLRPEKLGFLNLLCLLFSPSLQRREFVDCSEEREERFERRWIIFVSLATQKLLLSVAGPLSWVGSLIERWLNLVRINGGLTALLLNLVRGKAVMPVTTSADFVSFIGNLDLRVDFDENIRPEDENYYAQLSLMASKASYENEAYLKSKVAEHWKMDFLGFNDFWNEYQERATTQAFMLRDGDTIVVAFRGTEPFNSDDWCSDFNISWYKIPGMGTVHGGFMKALGLQKNLGWPKEIPSESSNTANSNGNSNPRLPTAYYFLREKLRALLGEDNRAKFIVTGHSLGGALAVLFPAVLGVHGEKELLERLEGVYTFGQPRVGDGEFGIFMQKLMREHRIGYYRFVYGNDMVPRLPYDNSTFLFEHFGKCRYYDSHYREQILDEVPNKNYFSLRSAIPMMVNAMYELRRSFTIVSSRGPEYRESPALRFLRVIGLLVPGAPAHCPMDYSNSIRLGRAYKSREKK